MTLQTMTSSFPASSTAQPPLNTPAAVFHHLADIFTYVFHVDSFLALGVLSLTLSALDWVGNLPHMLSSSAFLSGRLIWCIYFFLVIRKAAQGSRRLPVPSDYLDTWDALIQPLWQALFATAWYWIPLAVLTSRRVGLLDFLERYQAHPTVFLMQHGWSGYLTLGLGLLYVPLALISAVSSRSILIALDPRQGLRLAWCCSWAYLTLHGILSLLGLLGILMSGLATLFESALPIPLATPVFVHLLCLWVPLAQARLLGDFIYRNRSALGAIHQEGFPSGCRS
jgi:hypothetical protein